MLGTGLALAMLLLGLVMSGLAAWVTVWAPHIAASDAAHYSGLVVSECVVLLPSTVYRKGPFTNDVSFSPPPRSAFLTNL